MDSEEGYYAPEEIFEQNMAAGMAKLPIEGSAYNNPEHRKTIDAELFDKVHDIKHLPGELTERWGVDTTLHRTFAFMDYRETLMDRSRMRNKRRILEQEIPRWMKNNENMMEIYDGETFTFHEGTKGRNGNERTAQNAQFVGKADFNNVELHRRQSLAGRAMSGFQNMFRRY